MNMISRFVVVLCVSFLAVSTVNAGVIPPTFVKEVSGEVSFYSPHDSLTMARIKTYSATPNGRLRIEGTFNGGVALIFQLDDGAGTLLLEKICESAPGISIGYGALEYAVLNLDESSLLSVSMQSFFGGSETCETSVLLDGVEDGIVAPSFTQEKAVFSASEVFFNEAQTILEIHNAVNGQMFSCQIGEEKLAAGFSISAKNIVKFDPAQFRCTARVKDGTIPVEELALPFCTTVNGAFLPGDCIINDLTDPTVE